MKEEERIDRAIQDLGKQVEVVKGKVFDWNIPENRRFLEVGLSIMRVNKIAILCGALELGMKSTRNFSQAVVAILRYQHGR